MGVALSTVDVGFTIYDAVIRNAGPGMPWLRNSETLHSSSPERSSDEIQRGLNLLSGWR